MKLSQSSTIYRSAKFHHYLLDPIWGLDHYSHDLCTFLRHYVWTLARNTVLAFFGALLVFGMLFDVVLYLVIGKYDPTQNILTFSGATGWLLAVCVTIGFTIGAILYHIVKFISNKWGKRRYDEDGEPIQGVFATYMKARKEKYCPTLEITE